MVALFRGKRVTVLAEEYYEAEHLIVRDLRTDLKEHDMKHNALRVCVLSPDSDVVLLMCSCWQEVCMT
jgi:hypothetical protein